MGGYGSGRPSTTNKLDEGLTLDINKIKRDGAIAHNAYRSGTLTWTKVDTGKQTAAIGYKASTVDQNDMWFRVHYTHKPNRENEPVEMDYKIKLETTQPHYGGKRFWFICPLTNERAAILHNPLGSKWFASRLAFNLKYQSQSLSEHDRAIEKMWKLKNKLGGHFFWHKPKHMHTKTYERLLCEINTFERALDGYILNDLKKK